MADELLNVARQHHRAGRLAEAQQAYRKILLDYGDNPDALYGLALAHFALGQGLEALPLMRRAVAQRPERAEYHYNLGVLLNSVNQVSEAIAAFRRALALRGDFPEAIFNLAGALHADGKLTESVAIYRRLIELHPDHAGAYLNLGNVLVAAGEAGEALAAFERACEIRPDLAEAHFNRGNVLRTAGRWPESAEAYREAVRLRPEWTEAWNNLGIACRAMQQIKPALAAFGRAVELAPNHVSAMCSIASIHALEGKAEEAIVEFERALGVEPESITALRGLATARLELGDYAEGERLLRQVIALRPDDASAHAALANVLLGLGKWEEGLREHEWRLEVFRKSLIRGFSQPLWDGGELNGRVLLLHAEGGQGDTIQLARYLPLAAARGAKIVFECQPALIELLGQIPGVWRMIPRGEGLPDFDVHLPLISLPWVFRTTVETVPAQSPLLVAPPDRVEKFRNKIDGGDLKVGLVWAGGPRFADRRSISSALLSPLAKIAKVEFFSLQKGAESSQKPPEAMRLVDFSGELTDFADTAGLLTHLDLLIGVDTAAVHLAGAMGKPVWTLRPFGIHRIWLVDREDTPWYPTMRLFSQTKFGDWETPVARVAAELQTLAARHSKGEGVNVS